MIAFIVALIITGLMLLMNANFTQTFLGNLVPTLQKVLKLDANLLTNILTGLIFFLVTTLIISIFRKTKEGFFFEVSKGLPRCSRGYIGRPNSFEFTSSNDINCGYGGQNPTTCGQVAEDAKNNPMTGWDGIVNVNPENIFGGCGCVDSGMTVYPYIKSQKETPCQQSYM